MRLFFKSTARIHRQFDINKNRIEFNSKRIQSAHSAGAPSPPPPIEMYMSPLYLMDAGISVLLAMQNIWTSLCRLFGEQWGTDPYSLNQSKPSSRSKTIQTICGIKRANKFSCNYYYYIYRWSKSCALESKSISSLTLCPRWNRLSFGYISLTPGKM